jgi:hypothetical protein
MWGRDLVTDLKGRILLDDNSHPPPVRIGFSGVGEALDLTGTRRLAVPNFDLHPTIVKRAVSRNLQRRSFLLGY